MDSSKKCIPDVCWGRTRWAALTIGKFCDGDRIFNYVMIFGFQSSMSSQARFSRVFIVDLIQDFSIVFFRPRISKGICAFLDPLIPAFPNFDSDIFPATKCVSTPTFSGFNSYVSLCSRFRQLYCRNQT